MADRQIPWIFITVDKVMITVWLVEAPYAAGDLICSISVRNKWRLTVLAGVGSVVILATLVDWVHVGRLTLTAHDRGA
jgi:hypothetical protein